MGAAILGGITDIVLNDDEVPVRWVLINSARPRDENLI